MKAVKCGKVKNTTIYTGSPLSLSKRENSLLTSLSSSSEWCVATNARFTCYSSEDELISLSSHATYAFFDFLSLFFLKYLFFFSSLGHSLLTCPLSPHSKHLIFLVGASSLMISFFLSFLRNFSNFLINSLSSSLVDSSS